MRFFIFALALLLAAPLAAAEAPQAPAAEQETLEKDSAGLLVIQVNRQVIGFVFVSKTGKILPEPVQQCEANDKCAAIVKKLIEEGHVTTVSAGEESAGGPVT